MVIYPNGLFARRVVGTRIGARGSLCSSICVFLVVSIQISVQQAVHSNDNNNHRHAEPQTAPQSPPPLPSPQIPAQKANSATSPTTSATTVSHGPCNPASEFHCKLENRCIPLEWHCDFEEQCLDGQDELGCLPERCDFEHDHCYWLNALTSTSKDNGTSRHERVNLGQDLQQQKKAPVSGEPPSARNDIIGHDFWRRYSAGMGRRVASNFNSDSRAPNRGGHERLQQPPSSPPPSPPQASVATILEKLSLGLTDRSKFIFVPMTWRLPSQASQEFSSLQKASPAIQNQDKGHSGAWRRLAEIKTPTIGRTSSSCQLRFEYAIWTPKDVGGGSNAAISSATTRLRLVARHRRHHDGQKQQQKQQQQPLQEQTGNRPPLDPKDEETDDGVLSRTLWSRQVVWNRSNPILAKTDEKEPAGETTRHRKTFAADYTPTETNQLNEAHVAAHWTIGVAELGHLKRFELSFEAETMVSLAEGPRQGQPAEAGHASLDGSGQGHVVGAISAAAAAKHPSSGAALGRRVAPGGLGGEHNNNNTDTNNNNNHRHADVSGKIATINNHAPLKTAPTLQPAVVAAAGGFHGVLLALRSLDFHGCHDWPRGAANYLREDKFGPSEEPIDLMEGQTNQTAESQGNRQAPQRMVDQPDEAGGSPVVAADVQSEEAEEWPLDQEDEDGSLALEAETLVEEAQEEVARCLHDEFQCSNGACLPTRKLCNFVDECTSLNGHESTAWRWWSKPATMMHNNNHDDDESDDLCQPVLGRENFELMDQHQPGEPQQMQLFSSSQPRKFWHLTGSWPISRVSIRRAAMLGEEDVPEDQRAHWPQHDHTHQLGDGSYLNLEAPPSNVSLIYWATITSQWMQRLNSEEFGECRLKFFYNFISAQAAAVSTSGNSGAISESSSRVNLKAPKLGLALEHISLSGVGSGLAEVDHKHWPFGRQQQQLIKTVDTLLHSDQDLKESLLTSRERSHSLIELPGVDFWREANLPVAGLNEGDYFQLRLVIFLQMDAGNDSKQLNPGEPAGSVSIDDLATHFGCGPVEDVDQLERLDKMALDFWQGAPLKLDDYLKQVIPTTTKTTTTTTTLAPIILKPSPLRHKWEYFWPSSSTLSEQRQQQQHHNDSSFGAQGNRTDHLEEDYYARQSRAEPIEPQKLIAYVLGTFCLIIGLIALIVFVMVPHVERAMMQHHNQIQLNLSGEISDIPESHSSNSLFFSVSQPSGSIGSNSSTARFGTGSYLSSETHFGEGPSQGYPGLGLESRRSLGSATSSSSAGFGPHFDWDQCDPLESERVAACKAKVREWRTVPLDEDSNNNHDGADADGTTTGQSVSADGFNEQQARGERPGDD